LDQQNRARWDWLQIERGQQALARALAAGGGDEPYVLQARIAACHAVARRADATVWPRIAALYAQLLQVQPSPVVALNRVVAILRSEGPFAA
ncbi:RNA polymerase subunit sigma-24, partial [Stenotrophomonas sp. SG1]|nr:RNA polymerase subunit sigma-24 [Stenotrophomonas sp. SG1]